MAQAATHPTAAVLGSPANSLGSPLSQFLSHRTKNHPANQKLRQSLSVNATSGFASSFFVSSHRQASVVLAVGSRAQRLQTASFPALRDRPCLTPLFCSHYPNASSRLFYLRTVPYNQQVVIGKGRKKKKKKEKIHIFN